MATTSATGGSATSQADDARVWSARPVVAWTLRVITMLTPIAASFGASRIYGVLVTQDTIGRPAFVAGLLVVAISVAIVVEHRMQRVIPLVALFNMALVFPDRAPNRFGVALRRGTAKRLKEQADVAGDSEPATDLLVLIKALGRHDPLTRGHSERVRAYSDLIAQEMGVSQSERDKLAWGALAHDVGKLDVRPSTLNKAGRPDDEEWAEIRNHPGAAVDRMAPLKPWLGDWTLAASQHHERFDGTGYPLGLTSDEISLAGRIVAVADAYDVMTSARSYKKPLPAAVAREELINNAGTQFDPDVVRAFLNVGLRKVRVAGPIAWLSEFTWLARLPQAATAASPAATATAATAATTAVSVATVVAGPLPPADLDIPEPREVAIERSVEEEGAPTTTSEPFEVPIDAAGETTTTVIVSTSLPSTSDPADTTGATSTTTAAPTTTQAPATTTTNQPSTTIADASTTTIEPTTTHGPVTTTTALPSTTRPTTTTAKPTTTTTTEPPTARAATTTTTIAREATVVVPSTTVPPAVDDGGGRGGLTDFTSPVYLDGRPGGADTFSFLDGTLTDEELPNYDTDRDDAPGLLLQKGAGLDEVDPTKRHRFWAPSPGTQLQGVPVLEIWVSVKDHKLDKVGAVIVSLEDCAASKGDCTTISTGLAAFKQPTFGEDFGLLRIELDKVDHQLEPSRSLMLNLMVHDGSDDDLWFAYGTKTYPSSFVIG